MTVTRSKIADCLFSEIGLNKKEAHEFVHLFFDEIRQILSSGQDLKLSGFGKFEVRQKAERMGRNPKTGEDAVISARLVIVFRPGKNLKSRVAHYVHKTAHSD